MWLAYLCFLAAVLLPFAPNQKSSSAADAIAQVRAEWVKDLHDKKLDEFAMLYTPDAVFLPPNGERISGRPAIRELTRNVMGIYTSNLVFHSITVEQSGDLAYDSGDFRETLLTISDGSTIEGKGNYLMVFKRQSDGKWLITQQVWTESAPAHQ